MERFLAAVGKPVEELSVQDVLAYASELAASGLSRASIAHYISAVRAFLRRCQALELVRVGPPFRMALIETKPPPGDG